MRVDTERKKREILELLRKEPLLSTREIVERIGCPYMLTLSILRSLRKEGKVEALVEGWMRRRVRPRFWILREDLEFLK